MTKVSKESIALIHGLCNSPGFMAALAEICIAEEEQMVESTRRNVRSGNFNLATVSEAATNVVHELPSMFKKYADRHGRK